MLICLNHTYINILLSLDEPKKRIHELVMKGDALLVMVVLKGLDTSSMTTSFVHAHHKLDLEHHLYILIVQVNK